MNDYDNNSCRLITQRTENNISNEPEKFRRSITIILENQFEYNRLTELLDSIMYQSKLMNYYGLDTNNGRWDLTQYPVTRCDKQLEGIRSDIQEYNNTIRQYNEYANSLALDYGIDINYEMKKGCKIIFRSPESSLMA